MKHTIKKAVKQSKGIGVHNLLDVAVAADIFHTIHNGAYSILWIVLAVVPLWFIFRTFIALADHSEYGG